MVSRTTTLVAAGAGLAALAGAAHLAAQRTVRSWADNPDPTGGRPQVGPEGERITITTDDGARLSAVDTGGDGDPVVLIHGWTGDVTHWAPVARRLADAGHRVISVEQRGHGRSSVGDAGFSVARLGDDVAEWIRQLDLRDVVVAGHSMGGLATMSFAMNHGELRRERVRGLTIVSSLYRSAGRGGFRDKLMLRLMATSLAQKTLEHPLRGPLAVRDALGSQPVLAHAEAARATYLATPHEHVVTCMQMMLSFDISAGLPAIDTPTQVIVGTDDRMTPAEWSREIAKAVPGAVVTEIEGKGHMLTWEAPDAVADAVTAHRAASVAVAD